MAARRRVRSVWRGFLRLTCFAFGANDCIAVDVGTAGHASFQIRFRRLLFGRLRYSACGTIYAVLRDIGLAGDAQFSVRHQNRGDVFDEYGRIAMRAIRFSANNAFVRNDAFFAPRAIEFNVHHDRSSLCAELCLMN